MIKVSVMCIKLDPLCGVTYDLMRVKCMMIIM